MDDDINYSLVSRLTFLGIRAQLTLIRDYCIKDSLFIVKIK